MRTEYRGIKYRTADNRADYVFDFIYVSAAVGWRIYIVSQPGYGSRDTSMVETHRLGTGARRYVCWTDPLRTLDQAKQVASLWADCTQEYIRSGMFRSPPSRPTVGDRTSMAAAGSSPPSNRHPQHSAPPGGVLERIRTWMSQ